MVEMNNLTILNFILKLCGPLHEWTLAKTFLAFQCVCSAMAFVLRFYCANLLYDTVQ
jgi:UDP-N-acetylglucosamine--dolichyl-phosphate N-acetylglucosaminephosphotransferase